MNEPINTVSLKDVSLVIATYNEEECIKYVLDELQQFDLGEIIIVDGNSTDNTKAIAKTYDVKFISQSKNGWGSAVKEGIDLTTLLLYHTWMVMVPIIRRLFRNEKFNELQ